MRDLRKYWREVAEIERGLAEFVFLAPRAGGAALVEVPARVAAKLLHANSHRLAEEQEIAAHKAAEEELRRRSFHDELRRKGVAVVPLGPAR